MSIYELDIGWALTANERRHLCWELIASDEVSGVFLAHDDVKIVICDHADYECARDVVARNPVSCPVFFSPSHEQFSWW